MITKNNAFEKQLESQVGFDEHCQNCSIDGDYLKDILYSILGLTETNDALRNCFKIGFERYSIHLGEKSFNYSLEKIEEAVHGFLGDSAARMIMKKINIASFHLRHSYVQ